MNHNHETIETIILFHKCKYGDITLNKALDLFTESVEDYKKANKRRRLFYIAKTFVNACLIMSVDYLTGAQALEVFNNLATDYEIADKPTIETAINKFMYKERKAYEKTIFGTSIVSKLVRMCKRKTRNTSSR